MAGDIVGADLEHLGQLSAAFETAGAEIAAKADLLDDKIQAAVDAFEATLSSLQSQATNLTGTIDQEMEAVNGQANSVQWTGANRTAFDADMASFKSVVQAGSAQINTDISAIKSQVDSSFNPVLSEFSAALKQSGDEVNTASTDLKVAVTNQQTALDQVGNVGWTNA